MSTLPAIPLTANTLRPNVPPIPLTPALSTLAHPRPNNPIFNNFHPPARGPPPAAELQSQGPRSASPPKPRLPSQEGVNPPKLSPTERRRTSQPNSNVLTPCASLPLQSLRSPLCAPSASAVHCPCFSGVAIPTRHSPLPHPCHCLPAHTVPESPLGWLLARARPFASLRVKKHSAAHRCLIQ